MGPVATQCITWPLEAWWTRWMQCFIQETLQCVVSLKVSWWIQEKWFGVLGVVSTEWADPRVGSVVWLQQPGLDTGGAAGLAVKVPGAGAALLWIWSPQTHDSGRPEDFPAWMGHGGKTKNNACIITSIQFYVHIELKKIRFPSKWNFK